MEEEKQLKPYKIMPGDEVVVYRDDIVSNNTSYTFYHCKIKQKQKDNSDKWYKKELGFKNGVDIPNGTRIKILKMSEKVRENPKDRYNAIWGVFIYDYEVVMEADAYKNEQEELESYQDTFY